MKACTILLLLALLFSLHSIAQSPILVHDINPGPAHSNPQELTDFNGKLFFIADDGVHGREPWISSGSSASTYMISDIYPGSEQYYLRRPTIFDDRVYFMADNGNTGREIWRTTSNGASLLMDIYPGSSSSMYEGVLCACLVPAANKMFFNPRDGGGQQGTHGTELWMTDGDNAVLVEDIYPGPNSSLPNDLVAIGEKVFFAANDNEHGRELWVSDGASTFMVKDIRQGSDGSAPEDLVAAGAKVFFTATDEVHGRELWVSDGSANGTYMVRDIRPGADGSNISFMYGGTSKVYFNADDGVHGDEFWTSTGSDAIMTDINPGGGNSAARFFQQAGNKVFFYANDGVHGAELWVDDGGNVHMVKDLNTGSSGSTPTNITAVGNNVYLEGSGELWFSDGTENGTRVLVDRDDGISNVDNIAHVGSTLYFTGIGFEVEGKNTGRELFKIENVSNLKNGKYNDLMVKVYPNPSYDRISFDIPDGFVVRQAECRIYNQLGTLVFTQSLNSNDIDISSIHEGMYFVEIIGDQFRIIEQIIIAR